jgi:hypothetical protein
VFVDAPRRHGFDRSGVKCQPKHTALGSVRESTLRTRKAQTAKQHRHGASWAFLWRISKEGRARIASPGSSRRPTVSLGAFQRVSEAKPPRSPPRERSQLWPPSGREAPATWAAVRLPGSRLGRGNKTPIWALKWETVVMDGLQAPFIRRISARISLTPCKRRLVAASVGGGEQMYWRKQRKQEAPPVVETVASSWRFDPSQGFADD